MAVLKPHPPLLVILGPTASGKTELALQLALRVGAEILSVDSMQVYRGMDIGTAKPSPAQRQAIPHHGLDLVEPKESFTVARFVQMADAAIADAQQRSVPLIAVGGTPLYYKALFEGLFSGPSAQAALRTRLASLSKEQMHRRLAEVDPQAAQRIHVGDAKRLVRALEVYELTGKPISTLQSQWSSPQQRHAALWIGFTWERDALNARINARVKAMLAAGWLEETRRLIATYGALSPSAVQAAGYRQLIEHLAGRLPLEEALESIKIATRQLARRQIKWFRRFPNVHWLRGDAPLPDNFQAAWELWLKPQDPARPES